MERVEPTPELFTNPVARYVAATRPPFLLAAVVPVVIGWAVAYAGPGLHPGWALATLAGILFIAAGVNVLNDYYDALNGTDGLNRDRVFPFTGGSRFIQNGVMAPEEMRNYGLALFAAGILVGLGLAAARGGSLVLLGMAGMLLGWGYSAPPLKLNGRGLGEIAVGTGFGVFIPLGTVFVQSGHWDPAVLRAAGSFAFLVTSMLYVNEFPDREADRQAGKWHWVVRLGAERAVWGYPLLFGAAYLQDLVWILRGDLPLWCLAGLLTLPLNLWAFRDLRRHPRQPRQLVGAIQATIAATMLHGLLMAMGIVAGGWR